MRERPFITDLQKTEGGSTSDLTSGKVTVAAGDGYLFYKIENPSAKSTIQVKMKVSYISNDPQVQNITTYAQTTFALRQ